MRIEIRGQRINPAVIGLVEYVVGYQSSVVSGISYTVEDVLSNQENREEIDDILKDLQNGIREEVKLNDSWNTVYKGYGKIGSYLLLECFVCIIGIILLASTLMFVEMLFMTLCALWIILFVIGGLGLYKIYREIGKVKEARDFFEEKDQQYILEGG